MPTFNFTQDGTQGAQKTVMNLTKPRQKYRLEISNDNGSWANAPRVDRAIVDSDAKMQKASDYIAQSFYANDHVFDSFLMNFERSPEINDHDKFNIKFYVDLYPDSGNNAPDMSGDPIASYSRYSWANTVSGLNVRTGTGSSPISFFNTDDKTYDGSYKIEVTQGTKYWLVAHLDQDLTGPGYITARGDDVDNSIVGYPGSVDRSGLPGDSIKVKSQSTGWADDANLKDAFLYAHHDMVREAFVNNLTVTKVDDSGSPIGSQVVGLSESDWFTGLELTGFNPYEYYKAPNIPDGDLYKLKQFYASYNQQIKAGNPNYNSLPNFSPEVMTSEWTYNGMDHVITTDPYVPADRVFYPTLHDANQFISYVMGGIDGAMIWATTPGNGIYRYQDDWQLFLMNGATDRYPDTEPNDPSLYLYNPRYYLMKLMSHNAGTKLLDTKIASPQFTYNIGYAWNMFPTILPNDGTDNSYPYHWRGYPSLLKIPRYQRPLLNGFASYDQANNKMLLTVVNSDSTNDISSNVNIQNFSPKSGAKVTVLNTVNNQKGMMSENGYNTTLENVQQGNDWLKVKDVSNFKVEDRLVIQSTSNGMNEYYKVKSIDVAQKIIHIKAMDGGDATIPCSTETRIFCDGQRTKFTEIDVIRLEEEVNLQETNINNASDSFTYNFPAHSVTLIELDNSHTAAQETPNLAVKRKSTYNGTIELSGTRSSTNSKIYIDNSTDGITYDGLNWKKTINLGTVGKKDVSVFSQDHLSILSPSVNYTLERLKPADGNADYKVDLKDFSLLMSSWHAAVSDKNYLTDFNQDGAIDLKDFSFLMAKWGS